MFTWFSLSQIVGRASLGGDAMLKGTRMTPGDKYTYSTSIDDGINYSEWGGALNIFSSHKGILHVINEKH